MFVHYDKEEPEDVEISLDSDCDDSVVIFPPGMLTMAIEDSGVININSSDEEEEEDMKEEEVHIVLF